jgi:rhodanese-related sulfurtransferase
VAHSERSEGIVRGASVITAIGIGLGLAFNQLGPRLPWIAEDRVAALETIEELQQPAGGTRTTTGYSEPSDPMAVGLDETASDLPQIPELERPVQIGIEALKRLVDAGAVVVLDAREASEYSAGHIPGALSMPYDEVSGEPERLQSVGASGRPIVVYCGGGACELSLDLAWDLIASGAKRVAVYMGGFPEWEGAGYPVEPGGPPGS